MQIRRVILDHVKNFDHFDRSFEDSWSGQVPEALLLLGPNGSGKSTLLSVIAQLWQAFADFILSQEISPGASEGSAMSSDSAAAMEIIGFDHEPIWVYSAAPDKMAMESVASHRESHRVGFRFRRETGDPKIHYLQYQYTPPGQPTPVWTGVTAETPQWVRQWADTLTENLLGKRSDAPNMVYLESESRQLPAVKERFSVQPEPEEFRWLARYEPTTSRRGSIQNYLYNLKVVDEQAYNRIVQEVNIFLPGKRLNSFDRATGQLMVVPERGTLHPIDDLSSGEKQVLLMLATVTRWLRPGGIVLVDEPDLHLHVSLATALVSHLRRMVVEGGGQLIIASHMPELWGLFTDSHTVRLGASPAGKGETS